MGLDEYIVDAEDRIYRGQYPHPPTELDQLEWLVEVYPRIGRVWLPPPSEMWRIGKPRDWGRF